MDLAKEGDAGVRILTPRHISPEKSYADTNNAINATLLCYNYNLQPDFGTYLTALQGYATGLWVSGFGIVLTICILYGLTLKSVWRHSRASAVNAAFVLAVYPVVGATSYVATVVPRAMLVCEAIAQQAVMIAMYHFCCMIIADCGGSERLVRRAGECRLETRVPPCCCWPCCIIPRPQIQKRHLSWIRCLVLQMPIIQALIYICILIIWAEDMLLYVDSLMYFQPFVAASILSGLWGVMMCVRACEAGGGRPRARLLALQLALLVVKLQGGAARAMPRFMRVPCLMPLHPSVFVNLLQNSVTIVEMLLLSVLAWRLYSSPLTKIVDKVQHAVITTVDDNLDVKALSDMETKSFKFKGDF